MKILKIFGAFFFVTLFSLPAQAVTIGGQNYDLFLSAHSPGSIGYWVKHPKYYTGNNNAIKFDSVKHLDEEFSDFAIDSVYAMGMTTSKKWSSAVRNGVVELFDDAGALLLAANYSGHGSLNAIRKKGVKGQLDIVGAYNVTGGVFRDLGLVTGTIYVEMLFDSVRAYNRKDIHANNGLFNFYKVAGGGTPPGEQIPEPMSLGLLLSGLVGTACMRRRRNLNVRG